MVVHTCNPSTQEANARGLLTSSRPASKTGRETDGKGRRMKEEAGSKGKTGMEEPNWCSTILSQIPESKVLSLI